MEDVIKVSHVLLKQAKSLNINDMTNLKLQKLLYLLYKEYLKKNGPSDNVLFNEPIRAWRHGPVVKKIYDKYKVNGSKVIEEYDNTATIDKEIEELIVEVLKKHGKKNAWDLVSMTHEPNGAWYKTLKDRKEIIEPELISQLG